MKTKIFTLVGICFLFFSCQNELLDVQEEGLVSASSSSASSAESQCVPDLMGLELGLPDVVNVTTVAKPGNETYFLININNTSLQGQNIPTWCVDQDLSLENNETADFDVYSSYETLPADKFEKPENFDLVNWVINQSFVGKESPNGLGQYTFGHVQYALWLLVDDSTCEVCTYLTNPLSQWNSDPNNVIKAKEIADAAIANGEGFVPGCGQQVAIVLVPENKQSIIITMEVPSLECNECEGKVDNLQLKYNGDQPAKIVVETKKDGEDGSKIVFEGNVAPGEIFSFNGNDKKGTLGTEITILVNGNENTKIHTSCSKPIGPGLISGDFEVVGGSSREGGNLCPVNTPPGGDCGECEGKVSVLELQYNGGVAAKVAVETKKEGEDGTKIVFEGTLQPGEIFEFYGNDKKGTLGTEIVIYVNGKEYAEVHTSCSKPIGPGLIIGDFEVVGGSSREGGDLCPVNTPPGGDCKECKGGVTSFTFEYTGTTSATLKVQVKDKVIFNEVVNPGQSITLNGSKDDGKFEDNNLIFTLDGKVLSAPEHDSGKIHVSCSKPFYVGLPIGDKLVVTAGTSKDNGPICPKDTPPGGNCDECEGKVSRLDLQFGGTSSALIEVIQKKDNLVAFSGNVNAGEIFTFYGKDDKGTLGTEITIYVNGVEKQKIHTSCSVPIGAGSVFGSFKVIGGASREGGEFCPIDTPPGGGDDCKECKGGVTSFTFKYTGSSSATLKVQLKNSTIFNGTVTPGQMITLKGTKDDGKFDDNNLIFTMNGNVLSAPEHDSGKIHVSCSKPFYVGLPIGDKLIVTAGTSKDNGPICEKTPPTSGTACDCEGKIVAMSVKYDGPNGATIKVGADENGNNSKTFTNVQKGQILTANLGEIGNWWYWSVNGKVEGQIHTSCSDDILGNVDAHKSYFGNLGSFPDPVDNDNDGTFLVVSHTDSKGNTCSIL